MLTRAPEGENIFRSTVIAILYQFDNSYLLIISPLALPFQDLSYAPR